MNNFKGKNAYIVGGSSGIGLATAKLLFAHGADITLFSRDAKKLDRAAQEIAAQRASAEQTVTWMQMDVIDRHTVATVLKESVKNRGIPDILINCAGRAYPGYFADIGFDQLDETMHINFYGMWHTIKTLAPLMQTNGGYIVNVASIAGFIGVFGFTDYSASKFAVMGFSEALRSELKPFNIMVSVLCPPDTDTPALEVENRTKPAETREISKNAGLMQPEAVAKALLHGMRKKQPVIVPGVEAKLTYLAKRWAPSLVEKVMDGAIRRVQKHTRR